MDKKKLRDKDVVIKEEHEQSMDEKNPDVKHLDCQKKISALEDEVKTLKDTLLRMAAESENLKKRYEKEKHEAVEYSNTKFAKELLSVLDNFERIMENSHTISDKIASDPSIKAVFDGIVICEKDLLSVFQKHGLKKIDASEGIAFDPHYHQAMCEIENHNYIPGSIIKVFQTGYVYNDRLLRPSMVSVSKK